MSKSNSNDAANSTPITTVPDTWELIPCVQYGFPKDKGPIRAPTLQTIFEPIPDDAETASPVYLLKRDQYNYLQSRENPYQVEGYTSIATELQDQCEAEDDVLYPVHIESDVYHEEGPATLIEWFREFVEDYLEIPFHTCTLYFSGRRSIHVHVPRFVSGEDQREHLKGLAKTFCTEEGAELDSGLYSAKRMFRLPGVEHAETGLRKVETKPGWEHNRIIREANNADSEVPQSYANVLRHVFVSQESLRVDSPQSPIDDPLALFRILDSEKVVLEFELDKQKIETPLIEEKSLPDDTTLSEKKRWWAYRDKEFSPYALASGGSRSVAVVTVKGSPFAREDVTGGGYGHPVHALIPAFFHGARGCAGEEYTKDHKHAPLQLSKLDYKKWTYQEGDHAVIIGGKNNQSIIFCVEPWQATVVGHALTGEGASRDAALEYLESEGYDVGKAGASGKAAPSKTTGRRRRGEADSRSGEETEAAELQRRAEHNGVDTLGFTEVSNVANRLLRIGGWSLAWEWCKEQFGEQFKPDKTWTRLKGIVECYDDLNVEVPPKPR